MLKKNAFVTHLSTSIGWEAIFEVASSFYSSDL